MPLRRRGPWRPPDRRRVALVSAVWNRTLVAFSRACLSVDSRASETYSCVARRDHAVCGGGWGGRAMPASGTRRFDRMVVSFPTSHRRACKSSS